MFKGMTSKDLYIALKRPNPIEYLMEKFSIETEEELFRIISHVTPMHYESFIKDMRKKLKNIPAEKLSITEQVTDTVITEEATIQHEQEVQVIQDVEKEA